MYYVIEAFINISNIDAPVESVEKGGYTNYNEALCSFISFADPAFEIHMEQKPCKDVMGYICDSHDIYRRIWVLCQHDTEEEADYFINQLFYEYAQVEAMEYKNKVDHFVNKLITEQDQAEAMEYKNECNELEHPVVG